MKQVCDNLGFCVLNFLSDVSTLPRLVVTSLVDIMVVEI